MKKTFQSIFSVVLALLLCFGSAMPVLAAGTPSTGTETSPADASIKKVLEMPEGTNVPTATFTFVLTAKSVDGNTDGTSLATMPAITGPTVSISASDTSTTSNGVTTISKETGAFLKNVTFPHAGIYIYTVTEQSGTYATGTGEIMTYSGASYDIEVYVDNGDSGLYIAAVNAVVTT
ncbi:MAG: Spy0128 family protein, partial [Sporomusa sp.]